MSKAMELRTVIEKEGKNTRINMEEIKGTQEYIEKYFPIVKASTLSLEDEFLKHEPKTENQTRFKNALISAIKVGVSDFRAQRMDPSFDELGNICFKAGMEPAIGKLQEQEWKFAAKQFLPKKGSRLGTANERNAFLGLLIKYLIEEKGYTISDAWEAICDQSKDLGHYCDSENSNDEFECTGSRQIGKWYDLGNTFKITRVDEIRNSIYIFGGIYCKKGNDLPLVNAIYSAEWNCEFIHYNAVGWIVLSV